MSMERPTVLYVGPEAAANALDAELKSQGSIVHNANELFDALALVVFHFPDVVIIDAKDCVLAEQAFFHLTSYTGKLSVLVLDDDPQRWRDRLDIDATPHVRVMPIESSPEVVAMSITDFRKRTPVS